MKSHPDGVAFSYRAYNHRGMGISSWRGASLQYWDLAVKGSPNPLSFRFQSHPQTGDGFSYRARAPGRAKLEAGCEHPVLRGWGRTGHLISASLGP